MGSLRRAHQIVYDVGANWKLIVQNYNECLHCPTLHPALNRLSHYLSGENEPFRENYMGGRMNLNEGATTMSMDGTCPRAPLSGLSEEERRHIYYYSVFPNFMIAPHPDYVLTHTLWPLAPNHTRVVCDWLVDATEFAKPGFDLTDATAFWDMTTSRTGVCELAQRRSSSRGYQPGPYSNRKISCTPSTVASRQAWRVVRSLAPQRLDGQWRSSACEQPVWRFLRSSPGAPLSSRPVLARARLIAGLFLSPMLGLLKLRQVVPPESGVVFQPNLELVFPGHGAPLACSEQGQCHGVSQMRRMTWAM